MLSADGCLESENSEVTGRSVVVEEVTGGRREPDYGRLQAVIKLTLQKAACPLRRAERQMRRWCDSVGSIN